MFTRTKLALVGALVLGLGTVAQAGSRDDANRTGGYRVGPLSQSFTGANPASHRSMRAARMTNGRGAYAYVPGRRMGGETYIGIQDQDFRRSNGG
jgi:hypothetical protein